MKKYQDLVNFVLYSFAIILFSLSIGSREIYSLEFLGVVVPLIAILCMAENWGTYFRRIMVKK